ncbi:MAG: hypothetical protein FJ109_07495 [Deltaproteobacteria bacterium]|nr:hypothetical protein [Deltaproteobacteria bacterium]
MNAMILVTVMVALSLPGVAQRMPRPVLQVVQTIGSTEEVACLVPVGKKLWVGLLGGGMVRWDGRRAERFDAADGLPGNRVNDCTMAGGRLWVATDSGLARFDARATVFEKAARGRFLRVVPGGEPTQVAAGGGTGGGTEDPGVLTATADGRLLHVRCGATDDDAEEAAPCRARMVRKGLPVASSMAADRYGRWIVGGIDGRVLHSNGTAVRLDGPVTAVAFSSDGRGAAATPDSFYEVLPGPLQTVRTQRRFDEQLADDGSLVRVKAPSDRLVTAVATWNGRIAIGTDIGLYAADEGRRTADGGGSLSSVAAEPVSLGGCPCGPRLSSVELFRGRLWVGGFDGGLCRLDSTGWTRFAGPDYLPADMVNRLLATRRVLYVATLKGLVTVDVQGRFRKYVEADCIGNLQGACPWHQAVPGVALDPMDGTVWVADAGAVHNVKGNRWKHFFRRAGINTSEITRIAAGRDVIVVASLDSGLLVKRRQDRRFSALDERHGLADNWVMDVTVGEDGAIWAATCTRGVSRYLGGLWTTFTTREGLADDYTLSVKEIAGRMWVGTLKGVTVLSEAGPVSLSAEDGLAGNEVHDAVEQGDRVWLATDGGLSAVRYSRSVFR